MTIYCIYMEIVFRTIDLLCSMVWILAECTDLHRHFPYYGNVQYNCCGGSKSILLPHTISILWVLNFFPGYQSKYFLNTLNNSSGCF